MLNAGSALAERAGVIVSMALTGSLFACLVFGDSLALGTGRAINSLLSSPCEVRVETGAASTDMLHWRFLGRRFDTAILSVGSNEDLGTRRSRAREASSPGVGRRRREHVLATIANLRRALPSNRVIWMLPYDRERAAVVTTVAARFGDEVVDIAHFQTRDRLHPTDYRAVARALLR